jgi:hypothetical protein
MAVVVAELEHHGSLLNAEFIEFIEAFVSKSKAKSGSTVCTRPGFREFFNCLMFHEIKLPNGEFSENEQLSNLALTIFDKESDFELLGFIDCQRVADFFTMHTPRAGIYRCRFANMMRLVVKIEDRGGSVDDLVRESDFWENCFEVAPTFENEKRWQCHFLSVLAVFLKHSQQKETEDFLFGNDCEKVRFSIEVILNLQKPKHVILGLDVLDRLADFGEELLPGSNDDVNRVVSVLVEGKGNLEKLRNWQNHSDETVAKAARELIEEYFEGSC